MSNEVGIDDDGQIIYAWELSKFDFARLRLLQAADELDQSTASSADSYRDLADILRTDTPPRRRR